MASSDGVLVVGASLAGGRVAELLRRQGYDGPVTLVGAEPQRPYDRPPLSKKFLRGAHPEEQLYFRSDTWYAEQRITLITGVRATSLDAKARRVTLDDGRVLGFDKLVIATGADARRLTCPGGDRVQVLRTLADASAIRAAAGPTVSSSFSPLSPSGPSGSGMGGPLKRVIVVGGGVIGLEVAASLREEGLGVTVLESMGVPLVRAFGPAIGELYADIHRGRGVDLRCGVSVAEVGEGEVITTTGERLPCDFVVTGIGVVPATAWLAGSGVTVDDGVIVDPLTCETNVAGIYAAGDVARAGGVRLESVDNAQSQAAQIVATILGREIPPPPVPYFWSDQYDLKLQSVGHVGPYDHVVYRGSVADRKFIAFHVADGVLRFAVGINRLKEIGAAKKLIAARTPVSDAQLADETFSLATLLT